MSIKPGNNLRRGLKNRHIQLIALGGSIGTGLFLGVAHTIKLAGPSVIVGYLIAGIIAFLIMRQLGEMVVEEPVAGSFSYFAGRYWGKFAGFLSGWNYWILQILVSMAELTAIGIYVQYWWPSLPTWIPVLIFFIFINAINLLHVKMFGEMEFLFSIVKVLAIVSMICFGTWLLMSGTAGPHASITNLWELGGFFPEGIEGLIMAMAAIMFSFGGLELIGITAAEAHEPEKTLPKATNQIIYRILIFYIGALTVLLALHPWTEVKQGGSPFVLIFQSLDAHLVATALNIIILTAALSVYNSAVYCNTRMLVGLAQQSNAPQFLISVNAKGIPVAAVGVSAGATAVCVILNYLMPNKVFEILMMLVVAALVINWAMISLTHLKFRHAKNKSGQQTIFRSPAYPYTNYLCLVFMAAILVIMYITPSMSLAVLIAPIWIVILAGVYYLCFSTKNKKHAIK